MRRTTLSMLALGMAVILASCGGDDTPTGIARRSVPTLAVSSSQIRTQIDALFPAGSLRQSAHDQFTNVERKLAEGDTRLAAKMAFTLVDYTLRRFKQRQLLDPGGPSVAPTTRGAVAALIAALYTYVGEAPPTQPQLDDMLGAGVHVQVVDNTQNTEVLPPFGAALYIPAGAFPEPAIIIVELLPDEAKTLPGVPLTNQFGTFVDVSTVPSFAQFNEPVRIGLCVQDEADGGPDDERFFDLRVGHGTSLTTTELLPRVSVADILSEQCLEPPVVSAAPPSTAGEYASAGLLALGRATERVWRLVGPKPAYAVHSGMGGVTLKASPFGIVDPGTGPATLQITPAPAFATQGSSVQLTGTLFDADGDTVPQTGTTVWTSTKPAIATVSQTGVVTGVAPGTAIVFATYDSLVTGFDTVFVSAAGTVDLIISSGALSASPSTVPSGGAVTLSPWSVQNVGTASLPNNIDNGFYLSTDPVITATDTRLDGNTNTPSVLNPGQTFNWGGPTLTIPLATAPGLYYVGILVDEDGAVAESNEGNNYVSTVICVSNGTVAPFFGCVQDPVGDAVGSTGTLPDLVASSVAIVGGNAVISVRFAPGTYNTANTQTQISLDMDQNPATGFAGLGTPPTDAAQIGVEARITTNAQSDTWELISTSTAFPVTPLTMPLTDGPDGYDITIPLSALANDGSLNFKVTTYTWLSPTTTTGLVDFMSNVGLPATSTGSP